MQSKVTKSTSKLGNKMKSLRVQYETQKKINQILSVANKKQLGRKIKSDMLLSLALDLVTEINIKEMQERSLTNEDRKELLRQKWSEVHGPISKDAFIGVAKT